MFKKLFLMCLAIGLTICSAASAQNATITRILSDSLVLNDNSGTGVTLTNSSGTLVLSGGLTLGGSFSTGDQTISDATPLLAFVDSDTTDDDNGVSLLAAATDTGSGTEDVDFTISQQIAGTLTAALTFDADGNITFGTSRPLVASGGGSLTGTWSDLGTVTTVDLNGGTIDGTTIGATTPAAGTFNAVIGTTADFNSVTVDAGAGIDNQAAGALLIGAATATSVEIADTGVVTDIQGGVTIEGDIDTAGAGTMTIGASTATKVEIADSGVETEVQGDLEVVGNTLTANGVGAIVAATGLSLVEHGNEVMHKTVFTFTDVDITVTREVGDDSGYAAIQLYDFPAGLIVPSGILTDLDVNVGNPPDTAGNIADDGSGDFGAGITATTDSTINGNEVNLLGSTAMTEPFVGGVGVANGSSGVGVSWDGTGTAIDLFLNFRFDAGDVTTGNSTMRLNGTVTVVWANAGDF